MRKALKLLFFVFALISCFQLIGLEEAFCDDSIMDAGCQDCLMCAGHQFMDLSNPASLPVMSLSGYFFINYSFHPIDQPSFNFFHPPIAR